MLAHRLLGGGSSSLSVSCPSLGSTLIAAARAHLWSSFKLHFLFFFKELFNYYLFIYLFLALLSLCFCARAFSSCGKWGPLFIAVHGPLTIAASLVAEHRLPMRRLSSCGSRA